MLLASFKHCMGGVLLLWVIGFAPLVVAYSLNTSSWVAGEVTMQVDLEASNPAATNPPNVVVNGPSTAALQAAYLDAMATWNNSSTFSFSSDTQSGAVDPCPQPSMGGGNGVKFASVECDGAFGSTTLAVQQSWSSGGTRIQTGTIFNNTKQWDLYSGAYTGVAEFRRVAVHELGHGLGLGHENGVAAIMNSSIGNLEVPQADDLAGAAQFYDIDNDSIGLHTDNCPEIGNADQSDIDSDGDGDACDTDIDGDGVWNTAGVDVSVDPNPAGGSFYSFGPSSSNAPFPYAAQSFVSGISGDVSRLTLPVYCPQGYLTVAVRAANGSGPTTAPALASQIFSTANGLPTSAASGVDFVFSSPAALTQGGQYAVVLTAQNDCRWFSASTAYPGGAGYLSTNNGSWQSVGIDFGFESYLQPSTLDNCPLDSNADQTDTNNNGVGDACDLPDVDNDGVEDGIDNCPNDPNSDQLNNDLDLLGDVCDPDDDNDQLSDVDELGIYFTDPLNSDTDGDGVSDGDEVAAGTNPLVPDLEIPVLPLPLALFTLGICVWIAKYSRAAKRAA